MLLEYINTYTDTPTQFEEFMGNYFITMDTCITNSFNKFYAAEVFDSDYKYKFLEELNLYYNSFWALVLYQEQYEQDVVNGVSRTKEEYLAMFHLDCIDKAFLCSQCSSLYITDIVGENGAVFDQSIFDIDFA